MDSEAVLARARDLGARAGGEPLRALASATLARIPDDLFLIVRLAIALRDAGLFAEADAACEHILRRDPAYSFALYERGVSYTLQGRHAEALASFARNLEVVPDDPRTLLFMARLEMRLGRHDASGRTLARLRALAPGHEDLPWLAELDAYLRDFPAARVEAAARAYEQDPRYAWQDRLTGRVRAALAAGRGFSLVRLGDGEGAFLRISDADEARFPNLYRRNRRDRARVWFGGEVDPDASGFTAMAAGLAEVVRGADAVGLPYPNWVAHEYRIISPTGIPSLANALRLMPDVDTGQSLCPQAVHTLMDRDGHLAALLRDQARVGVISCHAGLPGLLARDFGLRDVAFHKIPGEKLHAAALGPEAVAGRHFPDRFREVMAALERPLGGRLYLVAGGILGKFYCDRIKRSGGVALDVGSVVDGWLGADTRAGSAW
ncbi:hypothetical protein OPKNFCMD_1365 [Methylobacterium crusticola]|uniref:Tetratricopeptide repeat protein n=1 Tax=Methylobacterium crusticola TaxID=1697972 RepID=A0ABQ4QTI7_9HYPH|nr:tetratricopeptide repeat protein [Methylobacterium crusticola]GJD48642.1 hypothetical protein OPKNFCMD_1365 [Methylobacterium crusticola]